MPPAPHDVQGRRHVRKLTTPSGLLGPMCGASPSSAGEPHPRDASVYLRAHGQDRCPARHLDGLPRRRPSRAPTGPVSLGLPHFRRARADIPDRSAQGGRSRGADDRHAEPRRGDGPPEPDAPESTAVVRADHRGLQRGRPGRRRPLHRAARVHEASRRRDRSRQGRTLHPGPSRHPRLPDGACAETWPSMCSTSGARPDASSAAVAAGAAACPNIHRGATVAA